MDEQTNTPAPRQRRPRGKGKSARERYESASDRKLLDWLKNGKTVVIQGPDGPVTVRRDLTAAEMNAVLRRMAQLKCGPSPSSGNLIDAARARGIGIAADDGKDWRTRFTERQQETDGA